MLRHIYSAKNILIFEELIIKAFLQNAATYLRATNLLPIFPRFHTNTRLMILSNSHEIILLALKYGNPILKYILKFENLT